MKKEIINFCNTINIATKSRKSQIIIPKNSQIELILNLLQQEGLIRKWQDIYNIKKNVFSKEGEKKLIVFPTFNDKGNPIIKNIKPIIDYRKRNFFLFRKNDIKLLNNLNTKLVIMKVNKKYIWLSKALFQKENGPLIIKISI